MREHYHCWRVQTVDGDEPRSDATHSRLVLLNVLANAQLSMCAIYLQKNDLIA